MYCPKCGFNLKDDNEVEVCPECGAKLRESTEKKEERAEAKTKKSGMKYAVAAAAAVAVLCGGFFIFKAGMGAAEKPSEPSAESGLELVSITVPEGTTEIKDYEFAYYINMESITIPDSVTKIGTGAFDVCVNLKSINIPEGVTEIAENAFSDCSSLESINIPESVTEIAEANF